MKLNRISPEWLEVLIYAVIVMLLMLFAIFLILIQAFITGDIILCQAVW